MGAGQGGHRMPTQPLRVFLIIVFLAHALLAGGFYNKNWGHALLSLGSGFQDAAFHVDPIGELFKGVGPDPVVPLYPAYVNPHAVPPHQSIHDSSMQDPPMHDPPMPCTRTTHANMRMENPMCTHSRRRSVARILNISWGD